MVVAVQKKLTDYETCKKSFYFEQKNLLLYQYLGAGDYPALAAKKAGMSRQQAAYYINKWEKTGILKRITKWPAFYEITGSLALPKSKNFYETVSQSKNTPQDFLPHRFGFKFLFRRKPRVLTGFNKKSKHRYWYKYTWLEGDFTVEAYPNLLKVWCHNHSGADVEERLRRATEMVRERAKAFEREQGLKLCAGELMEPVEWTINNQHLSDYVRALLDLDNSPVFIAQSQFCMDKSHPDKVEINRDGATEATKTLEWLITDGKPAMLASAEMLKEIQKQIEQIAINQSDIVTYLKLNKP